MYFGSSAEIFGMDGIIVLVVVVLVLFGSTQIPKLARSLGSAQKEFKKGVHDGDPEHSETVQVAIPVHHDVVVTSQPESTVAPSTNGQTAAGLTA
jgi:sec-independent protein translocase protein TatA